MDEVQAGIAAGLDMTNTEDSALRVYYDGHLGDTIQIHNVSFKGSANF